MREIPSLERTELMSDLGNGIAYVFGLYVLAAVAIGVIIGISLWEAIPWIYNHISVTVK
jgi:hypothetical protein